MCFWVFLSFPLVFRRRRVFVFVFLLRETAQVVTGHTPTRTLCSCSFFLSLSPAATGFISRFGRASFLSRVLSGCHSGPPFLAIFGFSRYLGGFEITRPPSEAPFLDARRQGCFFASCACFCFPLFVLLCGRTPFLVARVGVLAEVGIRSGGHARPSPE